MTNVKENKEPSIKIQFFTYQSKCKLISKEVKVLAEEGWKLFQMYFNLIGFINENNKEEIKESVKMIQHFLDDHDKLYEVLNKW